MNNLGLLINDGPDIDENVPKAYLNLIPRKCPPRHSVGIIEQPANFALTPAESSQR